MIHRDELDGYLKGLLAVDRFKDYGPNGLQVEGRAEVRKVVSGVTASLALIEAAVDAGADAIVVHHGLFWRGQDGRVTGWMKKRLQRLLAADVNLFAYHLPLDAHPELGNNAQLARRLGLTAERSFGDQELGLLGVREGPVRRLGRLELSTKVASALVRGAALAGLSKLESGVGGEKALVVGWATKCLFATGLRRRG